LGHIVFAVSFCLYIAGAYMAALCIVDVWLFSATAHWEDTVFLMSAYVAAYWQWG